jgi:hypothetical protein
LLMFATEQVQLLQQLDYLTTCKAEAPATTDSYSAPVTTSPTPKAARIG